MEKAIFCRIELWKKQFFVGSKKKIPTKNCTFKKSSDSLWWDYLGHHISKIMTSCQVEVPHPMKKFILAWRGCSVEEGNARASYFTLIIPKSELGPWKYFLTWVLWEVQEFLVANALWRTAWSHPGPKTKETRNVPLFMNVKNLSLIFRIKSS